jgi:hypothetical protein
VTVRHSRVRRSRELRCAIPRRRISEHLWIPGSALRAAPERRTGGDGKIFESRDRACTDSATVHLDKTKLPSRPQLARRRRCHGTPLFYETCFYCGRRRWGAGGKRTGCTAVSGITATRPCALTRWCCSGACGRHASRCRSSETRAGPLGTSLAPASLGLAPASLASAPLGLGAPSPLVTTPRVTGLLS